MTNKNLLILAPYFFPYENPRSRRVLKVVETLDEAGFYIHIVCSKVAQKPTQLSERVSIYPVGFNAPKEWFFQPKQANKPQEQPATSSPWMARLKQINIVVLKSIYWPDDSFTWLKDSYVTAEEIVQKYSINAVLSFSLPFASILTGLKLKRNHPNLQWITDIGDPLNFQVDNPMNNPWLYKNRNKQVEKQALITANLSIVTNPGLQEKYISELQIPENKLAVVGPFNQVGQRVLKSKKTESIHLLFMGSFYPKIRRAQVLLQHLENLVHESPNTKYRITLAGNLNHSDAKLFKNSPLIGKITELKPYQDTVNSQKLIQEADFLINLNNTTSFQLPSKCADYLASGLPIINITQHANDPSTEYFKNYPLCLHVSHQTETKKLLQFILANKDQRVSEYTIESCLKESNPTYYKSLILNVLKPESKSQSSKKDV